MEKSTTLQLKGIAILLMLWLHLFSSHEQTSNLVNTIYFWNGDPLTEVMKKICSMCVPIYIFLGGYGLAVTRERAIERGHGMNNARRVMSLYANLWVVFLLFYPLGAVFNPALFRTGIYDVFLNFVGLKCSMNGAWWFLLPYAILTMLSWRILKFIYSVSAKHEILILIPTFVFYVCAYTLVDTIRFDGSETVYLVILNVLRVFLLLFMFMIGAMFARHRLTDKLRQWLSARWNPHRINVTISIVVVVLLLVKLSIGSSSLIHPWFVMILIPCYAVCTIPSRAKSILEYFGRHSTNMWLTHYFFAHYIFGDAIYSLRYPVVIYAVLVVVSLVSSHIVALIYAPIRKIIRR